MGSTLDPALADGIVALVEFVTRDQQVWPGGGGMNDGIWHDLATLRARGRYRAAAVEVDSLTTSQMMAAARQGRIATRDGRRRQYTTVRLAAEHAAELALTPAERAERAMPAIVAEYERNLAESGDDVFAWPIMLDLARIPQDGIGPAESAGLIVRVDERWGRPVYVPADYLDAYREAWEHAVGRADRLDRRWTQAVATVTAACGPARGETRMVEFSLDQLERLAALTGQAAAGA